METTSKSLVSVEEVADFLEERLRCIIHLSLPDTLPLYTCLTCGSAICQECLVAYRKRGFEECPCCASDVRLLAHNRPLEVLVQHLAFICDISTVDEDGKMASCSLRVPFPQLKEHRLLHEKYQGERRKSGEVRNENLSPTIEKPKESPKRKRSTSNEGQERGVTMTIAQFVSMERRDETAHNPRSFCSTADVLPRKLYSEEDEFAQGIHKYLQESRNIKPRPENNATMSPSSIGTMRSSEQEPPQIVGSPNRTMTQPPSSPSVTPSKKPRVQPSPISPKSHSANKNDIRITTDAIDRNSSPYSSPSKIFRVGGHHD